MSADRLFATGAPKYDAITKMVEAGAEIEALWVASATRLTNAAGTNSITATSNPTLNAYAADNKHILVPANNTTGAVSIVIDSLASRSIVDKDGNALTATTYLTANRPHLLWDNGTHLRVLTGIDPATTAGSMVLVNSVSVSGSPSTVSFINGTNGVAFDDTTYDRWVIKIDDLKISADDKDVHIEIGTGATPTWQTGAAAYIWANSIVTSGDAAYTDKDASDPGIYITDKANAAFALGSASGESLSGNIEFTNPEAVNFPKFTYQIVYDGSADKVISLRGSGRYNTAAAITGVRIVAESGNTFASGRVSLYGIKKA